MIWEYSWQTIGQVWDLKWWRVDAQVVDGWICIRLQGVDARTHQPRDYILRFSAPPPTAWHWAHLRRAEGHIRTAYALTALMYAAAGMEVQIDGRVVPLARDEVVVQVRAGTVAPVGTARLN